MCLLLVEAFPGWWNPDLLLLGFWGLVPAGSVTLSSVVVWSYQLSVQPPYLSPTVLPYPLPTVLP